MFFRMTSSWDPVQVADTDAERAAVRAFRDAHGEPAEFDDGPGIVHLYSGTADALKAVATLRIFEGSAPPADAVERFSLGLFPNLSSLRFAEIGRFVFAPGAAGRVLPSMARGVYDTMAGTERCDIALSLAPPQVVNHHRKLGGRPYGAPPVQRNGGLHVPLAAVLSDAGYLKGVGAITAGQVSKHFGEGKREPLDLEPLKPLFERDEALIESDSARIWSAMRATLDENAGPSLVDQLSESALRRMAADGLILEVPAGGVITEQGGDDDSILLILRGQFEVLRNSHPIATLGRGDVVGEVAFFLQAGQRSATVRSVDGGRVVVLRRHFLQELNRQDPDAAFTILMNLGRVLSTRLVGAIP